MSGQTKLLLPSGGSLTIAATDSAANNTMTMPVATQTVGYINVPQNAQNANYTLVLGDAGFHIYNASGASVTYTIPANSSVAYAVGTAVTFINMASSSVTISITSDTLYLAGTGSTGSRTLAQYGMATAVKITSTSWIISGNGLS